MPRRGGVGRSSAYTYCRNTLQVDDALEFMKDEYNTRMESCDQREVRTELTAASVDLPHTDPTVA